LIQLIPSLNLHFFWGHSALLKMAVKLLKQVTKPIFAKRVPRQNLRVLAAAANDLTDRAAGLLTICEMRRLTKEPSPVC
jgi:hypothetical protein